MENPFFKTFQSVANWRAPSADGRNPYFTELLFSVFVRDNDKYNLLGTAFSLGSTPYVMSAAHVFAAHIIPTENRDPFGVAGRHARTLRWSQLNREFFFVRSVQNAEGHEEMAVYSPEESYLWDNLDFALTKIRFVPEQSNCKKDYGKDGPPLYGLPIVNQSRVGTQAVILGTASAPEGPFFVENIGFDLIATPAGITCDPHSMNEGFQSTMILTAPSKPGQSGGPIVELDDSGSVAGVIGILSMGVADVSRYVPIAHLLELKIEEIEFIRGDQRVHLGPVSIRELASNHRLFRLIVPSEPMNLASGGISFWFDPKNSPKRAQLAFDGIPFPSSLLIEIDQVRKTVSANRSRVSIGLDSHSTTLAKDDLDTHCLLAIRWESEQIGISINGRDFV